MSADTKETNARRGGGRTLVGVVTSNKMQKTVVVQVSRRVRSEQYHKYMTRRVKYKAHAASQVYGIGDVVQIKESRPLSRDTRWRVEKLIEKAIVAETID